MMGGRIERNYDNGSKTTTARCRLPNGNRSILNGTERIPSSVLDTILIRTWDDCGSSIWRCLPSITRSIRPVPSSSFERSSGHATCLDDGHDSRPSNAGVPGDQCPAHMGERIL